MRVRPIPFSCSRKLALHRTSPLLPKAHKRLEVALSAYINYSLGACGGAPEGAEDTDVLAGDESALIGETELTAAQAAQTGILAIKDGCTATLVGSRHILTAAHCAQSPNYFFGGKIKIAPTGRVTEATVWTTVTINQTFIHPGWTAMCLVSSCAEDQTLTAPYSPDIAVIQLTANVPAAFKNTGRSVRNIHARLYDNGPTQLWLESILPALSFAFN